MEQRLCGFRGDDLELLPEKKNSLGWEKSSSKAAFPLNSPGRCWLEREFSWELGHRELS